jgi:hypothetical protein
VKLGGGSFYYVAVDGTDSVDSAQFGIEIEKFGFRNLYGELMKGNASASNPARIVDPEKKDLPIWLCKPTSNLQKAVIDKTGIAVVTPCGFPGNGTDPTWPAADQDRLAYESSTFMQTLMLDAGVYQKDKTTNALSCAAAAPPPANKYYPAHILTLSSHGWLGGFMMGNAGNYWTIIGGVAADSKLAFRGTLWLILAQCSTVCTATWPSWVRVMARSNPAVRGVLAYEEVAPAAPRAAVLANQFFAKMKQSYKTGKKKGKPISFVDAWKLVNDAAGRAWAAVVHKDAVDDSLSTFHDHAAKPLVVDPAKALADGDYLGWSQTPDDKKAESPIKVVPPPFDCKLEIVYDSDATKRGTVDETNLHQRKLKPKLKPDGTPRPTPYHYEVTLTPPGGKIFEATIEWVHIRRTKIKIKSSRIFASAAAADATVTFVNTGTAKTDKNHYSVKVNAGASLTKLVVRFDTVDSFDKVAAGQNYHGDDKIVEHHSYLWVYASLKTDAKSFPSTEFTTRGLIYNGPG